MHAITTDAGYGGGKLSFIRGGVLVAAKVVLKWLGEVAATVVLERLGEVVGAGLDTIVRLVSFLQKPALQRQPAMLRLHKKKVGKDNHQGFGEVN